MPYFPDAEVILIGENGNTGAIMGRVVDALKDAGATPAERNEFRLEMLSGSYADALATVARWVTVTDLED